MTVITSETNFPFPETDVLTYIFDSRWKETQGWNEDEPVIVPKVGLESPSCTFNELRNPAKCFASGFQKIACPGARIVIYGMLDVYLPVVLFGVLGAEASCHLCPAYDVSETHVRLETLKADFVFFPFNQMESVREAASLAGIPEENLFLLDSNLTHKSDNGVVVEGMKVQHWSSLLDFENGPDFVWQHLTTEEPKNTTALCIHQGPLDFPRSQNGHIMA